MALADKPRVRLPSESVRTLEFINTQVVAILGSDESLGILHRLNIPPTREAIIDFGIAHETQTTISTLRAHIATASIGRLFLNHN